LKIFKKNWVIKKIENKKYNILPKNGNYFHTIGQSLPLIIFFLRKFCSHGMVFANFKRIVFVKPFVCAQLGKKVGNNG